MVSTNGHQADGDAIQLPVIDISDPTAAVGRQMIDAAIKYGFFYIEDNTGQDFDADVVDRAFELSRKFFSSPEQEKAECSINTKNMGWSGMHSEVLDPENQRLGDFKEGFNIGEFLNGKPQQRIPKSLAANESELGDFHDRCRSMCYRVLRLMAVGLEISDAEWLSSRHRVEKGPSGSIFRLLHYPAIPSDVDYNPETDIRAGAHSDYGSITLLFQRPSQPGLEILTPSNTWAPVPVNPPHTSSSFPPILVNIGDLLSYWTNGLLKSTVHRVIFPKDARRGGEDRYSIVYFCHPANETELTAVPSKMVQDRKAEIGKVGYGGGTGEATMNAREHLERRLAATYGVRKEADATAA